MVPPSVPPPSLPAGPKPTPKRPDPGAWRKVLGARVPCTPGFHGCMVSRKPLVKRLSSSRSTRKSSPVPRGRSPPPRPGSSRHRRAAQAQPPSAAPTVAGLAGVPVERHGPEAARMGLGRSTPKLFFASSIALVLSAPFAGVDVAIVTRSLARWGRSLVP